jgi:hypothetical protein
MEALFEILAENIYQKVFEQGERECTVVKILANIIIVQQQRATFCCISYTTHAKLRVLGNTLMRGRCSAGKLSGVI